jgi:DNA-binding HxlR family transcriptional regulator
LSTKSSPAKGIRDREPEHMEKCEIANIWQILGRRWTLLILKNLSTKEVIRFNELKTVLAERLLDLDREGLISKQIYPEIPPRVEYRLTTRAKELETVLKDLNRWCLRWKSPEALRAR